MTERLIEALTIFVLIAAGRLVAYPWRAGEHEHEFFEADKQDVVDSETLTLFCSCGEVWHVHAQHKQSGAETA